MNHDAKNEADDEANDVWTRRRGEEGEIFALIYRRRFVPGRTIFEKLRVLRKRCLPRGTLNYFNLLTMVPAEIGFQGTKRKRRKL